MASGRQQALPRIEEMTAQFDGVIGVAARHFGTGEEILFNPDEIFPTASTFKTVLLYELYRQVDDGQINPAERITIGEQHRVPGSGVLQDLDPGAALTIKDIATLMITVSDNQGTDIIYDLLGGEAIAAAVDRLGMTSTSLPFGTWGILAGMHNLDPEDPSLTYEELKHLLDTKQAPWNSAALSETAGNDISTPRDLLRLYEAIERGEGLSASSRDAVIDILKRQKFSERIPALLPFGTVVAHKTGSIKGVRNDAGIVYAGDTVYGIALMSKRAEDGVAATRLLADISKVVYEQFAGPVATPSD